jgi:hypothetical protein
LARPLYRSRQVLHALRPRIEDDDIDFVRDALNEGEARLFFAMQRSDQRHAIEVARRLQSGSDDREVLAAALLHDCGKGSMPLPLRILNVLAPSLVERLAVQTAQGWRGAAYRLRHHPALGAALAEAAGSTPLTVRLIHGDVEPGEAGLQQLLHAADEAS